MSSKSPDSDTIDDENPAVVAVDGRVVARLAEIDDLAKSPVDDAAIITLLRRLLDEAAEDFEEKHEVSPTEALQRAEPDIQFGNDAEGWEPVVLDRLTDDA